MFLSRGTVIVGVSPCAFSSERGRGSGGVMFPVLSSEVTDLICRRDGVQPTPVAKRYTCECG